MAVYLRADLLSINTTYNLGNYFCPFYTLFHALVFIRCNTVQIFLAVLRCTISKTECIQTTCMTSVEKCW